MLTVVIKQYFLQPKAIFPTLLVKVFDLNQVFLKIYAKLEELHMLTLTACLKRVLV